MSKDYHIPVMLPQCLDGLNIDPDGVYVDVTFGGGGHSRAIFERLSSKGKLISFDQDPDACQNTWDAPNFHFVPSNFAFIKNHLRMLGVQKVDGVLADLGVSSHQFDAGARGFSTRLDAPLDMRMNQTAVKNAAQIVNTYEEDALFEMFKKYGELSHVGTLIQNIVKARDFGGVNTTLELVEVAKKSAPKGKENKYYAQVFQAIRIEVNDEMSVLEDFLLATPDILKPKGRLVVMSYHSLEDRLVKNFIKRGSFEGKIEKDFFGNIVKPLDEVSRKPIVANEEEVEMNSRARSAKLRIAERRDG